MPNLYLLRDLIEELFLLGIANIFGGYKSCYTFPRIEQIIKLMEEHEIELPEFHIIEHCSVEEGGGWGERANMANFVNKI